jgi:hypothetical protein
MVRRLRFERQKGVQVILDPAFLSKSTSLALRVPHTPPIASVPLYAFPLSMIEVGKEEKPESITKQSINL